MKFQFVQACFLVGLMSLCYAGMRSACADGASVLPSAPAYRADDFTDFVGLNAAPFEIYLSSGPFAGAGSKFSPDTFFNLGIRHYRTCLKDDLTMPDAPQRISAAYDKYGAQAMLLIDPGKDGTPDDIVARLKTYEPGSVDLLEGPNEVNNKFPPQNLNLKYKGKTDEAAGAAYMDDVYAAVKADPATSHIGVVAYTAIFTDYSLARPYAAFDYSNMHSYQGSNVPSSSIEPCELNFDNVLPTGGVIKPFIPTECGYNVEKDHSNGTDETGSLRSQALNIPMLLAEYFRQGIKRAYLFALTNTDGYGLLESDQVTKRPSYYAVQNLLALIRDSNWDSNTHRWVGAKFTPQALDFTLNDVPSTVHTLTLQKSDGEYLLLIWNELQNYNQSTHSEIDNPPVPATLRFYSPLSSSVDVLTQDDTGSYDSTRTSITNGLLNIGVTSSITVLRLHYDLSRKAIEIAPPGTLTGSATENSVHVAWTPAPGSREPLNYFVYRNGQFLTSTSSVTFDDTSDWIRPSLGYTYSVQAVDRFGHMSALKSLQIFTPDKRPDLVCTTIKDVQAHAGDPVKFEGIVKNIGTGATPRNTFVALTFSVDGKVVGYGVTDGTPMLPGDERLITSGAWNATQGAHVVSAQVDDIDRIPGEISKENNHIDRTLSVDVQSAGMLSGSGEPAPSSVNLTEEGTSDWVLWGRTGRSSVDRKVDGGSQIGNLVEVGSGYTDATPSFATDVSWSDGNTTPTVTGSRGCLWCNCTKHGFQFDVPADTSVRTLRVYVAGINGAQCTFTAHLSDGSAPDYTSNTFNGNRAFSWAPVPGGFTTVYSVRYRAASAGQKLTVSWILASEPNQFQAQARLQAATLQNN